MAPARTQLTERQRAGAGAESGAESGDGGKGSVWGGGGGALGGAHALRRGAGTSGGEGEGSSPRHWHARTAGRAAPVMLFSLRRTDGEVAQHPQSVVFCAGVWLGERARREGGWVRASIPRVCSPPNVHVAHAFAEQAERALSVTGSDDPSATAQRRNFEARETPPWASLGWRHVLPFRRGRPGAHTSVVRRPGGASGPSDR
jgi:hypothetical protein